MDYDSRAPTECSPDGGTMLLGVLLLLLPLLPLVMVASAAPGHERAILEIVLYERNAHGEYETKVRYELRGLFSPAGAKTSAEGQILQVGGRPSRSTPSGPFKLPVDRRNKATR